MPGEITADLAIRPAPADAKGDGRLEEKRHKHSRSSHSEASPLVSRNNSLHFRPAKRSMPAPAKTIAVVNASGRQAASLIRYATAVGYHVRAQMRNRLGVIATEVATNPNVTVLEGELYTRQERAEKVEQDVTKDGPALSGIGVNHDLISELFSGAQLAFINTTFYGDEVKIGQALADAAKKADIQHYVFSSMPDHHAYDAAWPSLPLWATKHVVEDYVKSIGLPATFVYTGIYNNNFTSLLYPLFCMELQKDGTFVWQAPFHPDAKLPWLDAEHDVGPAILQIFKDGVAKWGDNRRIALAYEMLTPREACRAFARGVERRVKYVRGDIKISVPIPEGYRAQLEGLEKLFDRRNDDAEAQPPYFGDPALEADCPATALELWEGPRGLEEYAREVFPLEEQANGLTWMEEEDDEGGGANGSGEAHGNGEAAEDNGNDDAADDDDGPLTMRGPARKEEDWLA